MKSAFADLAVLSRTPKLRSMRRFAEEEIYIPEGGPYAGLRFNCDRQPFVRAFFDAIDWADAHDIPERVTTGPTQTGKTMISLGIPTLYHLFEVGETVILGIPNSDMARDKWTRDILPVIDRTRYKHLLPVRGGGSRGGAKFTSITFRNGATLRFMAAGGGPKQVAGYTSRVLIITETDEIARGGANTSEANTVNLLEGRVRAFGSRRRVYKECTVTTEDGHTWDRIKQGTDTRICLPCCHCGRWVTPEREHLVGWQTAESATEAADAARFCCPDCGAAWSEKHRIGANLAAKIAHRGQTIDADGSVVGDDPPTDCLGFRWSAVNNLFATAADVGAEEWRAAREPDEDNAERRMCQQVWAIPYKPATLESTELSLDYIVRRQGEYPRGVVPPGTRWLTAGGDLGKHLAHYTVIAWSDDASGQVVDYGRLNVPSVDMGVELALLNTLERLHDLLLEGYPVAAAPGEAAPPERMVPNQLWIDAGYQGGREAESDTGCVYEFCKRVAPAGSPQAFHTRVRPVLGRGGEQMVRYTVPTKLTDTIRWIGDGCHLRLNEHARIWYIMADADHWKTWLNDRLSVPADQPAALTLYRVAKAGEHLGFARHLTAEHTETSFEPGRGMVTRWIRTSINHWLDATYLACAAAYICGVRVVAPGPRQVDPVPPAPPVPPRGVAAPRRFLTPDGRPYLVTER